MPVKIKKEDQVVLAKARDSGDQKAAETLFMDNRRLAYALSKKYFGYQSLTYEDILQNAMLGLWMAAETWDYKKGVAFSTYATTIMKYMIWGELLKDLGMIHVRDKVLSKVLKMKQFIYKYKTTNANEPSDEEIAEKLNYSLEEVKKYKEILLVLYPVYNDCTLQRQTYYDNHLSIEISDILNGLNDFEKTVIYYRFGFIDGKCYTLEETAKLCGCGKEKIRYTQEKAIEKLRHIMKISGLHRSDFVS